MCAQWIKMLVCTALFTVGGAMAQNVTTPGGTPGIIPEFNGKQSLANSVISFDTVGGQIGSALGSTLGQWLRMPASQRIILVANDGRRYINEATAAYRNPRLVRDVASLPPAEYPEEPFMYTFLSLPNPKNVWAVADSSSFAQLTSIPLT